MSEKQNTSKNSNAAERRRLAKIMKDHLNIYPDDLSFSLLGNKFKKKNSSSNASTAGQSHSIDEIQGDATTNFDFEVINDAIEVDEEQEAYERSENMSQVYTDDVEDNIIEDISADKEEFTETDVEPFFRTKQRSDFSFPSTFKTNITRNDHLVSSLGRLVRFNLPYECLLSEFRWMNSITYNLNLPTSKNQLWIALSRNDSNFIRHYYCTRCSRYLGNNIQEKENESIQLEPTKKKKKNYDKCSSETCVSIKTRISYFIQVKLYPQLSELLSIPNICKSISYRINRRKINEGALEDIYDGIEYKKLTSAGKFLSNHHNMSFTLNTDGCNVSKSSKASAWPVYLEVNELPPHMRKRHMILAGIYCDLEKPILNTLVGSCLSELNDLRYNGIKWKNSENIQVISKFTLLICSVDSIARPPLLRMTQFNGEYGCTFCYAKGTTDPDNILQRYYSSSEKANIRSDEEMRRDMQEAFETRKKVHGVVGISCLISFPDFNLAKGPIVESMHSVYLGAAKHHIELLKKFVEPKFHCMINDRVTKIRPPSRISRAPRSIEEFANFKASEFRNWLLYYFLVCFDGLLDTIYLKHFALLAQAIYYLNQESVTIEEIDKAESLLIKYANQFEQLFGIEKMTYNIHLLMHLPETVRHWGPLWVHTAFPFESWNRRIIESIQSPKDRVLQATTRYCIMKFISNTLYDDFISQETKEYLHTLFPSYHFNVNTERHHFIGKGKSKDFPEVDIPPQYTGARVISFDEAKINNILYRISNKNETTQFCNCFVYCENVGFGEIEHIIELDAHDKKVNGIMLRRWKKIKTVLHTEYIFKIESTSDIIFVPCQKIIGPSIVVYDAKDYKYIVKLPNVWESD